MKGRCVCSHGDGGNICTRSRHIQPPVSQGQLRFCMPCLHRQPIRRRAYPGVSCKPQPYSWVRSGAPHIPRIQEQLLLARPGCRTRITESLPLDRTAPCGAFHLAAGIPEFCTLRSIVLVKAEAIRSPSQIRSSPLSLLSWAETPLIAHQLPEKELPRHDRVRSWPQRIQIAPFIDGKGHAEHVLHRSGVQLVEAQRAVPYLRHA